MYQENAKKQFTFEQTEVYDRINETAVKKIVDSFKITGAEINNGYLVIETFSNDQDDKLDYDLTLQVDKGDDVTVSYCLKTSNDLKRINEEYNKVSQLVS